MSEFDDSKDKLSGSSPGAAETTTITSQKGAEPESDGNEEVTRRAPSGTFDEQVFLDKIEKDPFQKELDEAIEQRTLSDFIASHDTFKGLYEFDAETLEYPIKTNGIEYKHRVKNPTKDDETRKELMSVTIRKSLGKVDGDEAIGNVSDNGNALLRYYNGIAHSIWGYPVNEGDDREQWITVVQVIESKENVSKEDRERYSVGAEKDLTVLHLIPESDKLKVAQLVHAGPCVVLREKNKPIRSLRSKREYVVKQLFGVKREDDGTLSKPTHCVSYHFAEAGAKAISKFDAYAVPAKLVQREAGNEEHRTLSIPTLDALFDAHITYIQGASISGEEVLAVLQEDGRLAKIPSACKRDATVHFFNALKS